MNSKYKIVFFLCFLCMMFHTCGQKTSEKGKSASNANTPSATNRERNTVATRFDLPKGFIRISSDSTSFTSYLRSLPLKPEGSLVYYYDGKTKPNRNVYAAVVDLPIGKRDLHQCADAVIRLRAEYFFQNKKYDSIHFNFTNGFRADYVNWRKGKRITVKGNEVYWKQTSQASDSPKTFWKYLEMVFSYAGTASLEKEMKSIPLKEMEVGDVFIQGGFPGHAVIIIDMAINRKTNEKIFLLAQSYMPAQELQVLKNLDTDDRNPWYKVSEITNLVRTPEWTFETKDLKRFSN